MPRSLLLLLLLLRYFSTVGQQACVHWVLTLHIRMQMKGKCAVRYKH